jgi:hypothetical protein
MNPQQFNKSEGKVMKAKKIFLITVIFAGLYVLLSYLAKIFDSPKTDSLSFYVIVFYIGSLMSSLNLTLVEGSETLKWPQIIHRSYRHTTVAVVAYVVFTTIATFPVWTGLFSNIALIPSLILGMICFDLVILLTDIPKNNTMLFAFLRKVRRKYSVNG